MATSKSSVGSRQQVPLNGPCEAALIRETNTFFYISVSLKVGAKIARLPPIALKLVLAHL